MTKRHCASTKWRLNINNVNNACYASLLAMFQLVLTGGCDSASKTICYVVLSFCGLFLNSLLFRCFRWQYFLSSNYWMFIWWWSWYWVLITASHLALFRGMRWVWKCIYQVDDGQVTLSAEVNSIYTLTTLKTGQKGTAGKIPLPADFPLPYKDSFDGCLTLTSLLVYSYFCWIHSMLRHCWLSDGKGIWPKKKSCTSGPQRFFGKRPVRAPGL